MGFTELQVRALSRGVSTRNVRTRTSDGKELSYIEGWYAVDRANRVFGFDAWNRETIENHCVSTRAERGTFVVLYCARVRITVWTGDRSVVRDGHGTGEATAKSLGEAHDRALKTAETDATKRALATFGKAFGLALYAGSQRSNAPPKLSPATNGTRRTPEALAATEIPAQPHQSKATFAAPEPIAPPADVLDRLRNGAIAKSGNRRSHIPIDKSVLTLAEPHRRRDKNHLRHVAAQPCVLCGAIPSDAHHLRFAQPKAMGRKVSDEFTVPLCRRHHREVHAEGKEAAWWHDMGIDPLDVAKQLWTESLARGV